MLLESTITRSLACGLLLIAIASLEWPEQAMAQFNFPPSPPKMTPKRTDVKPFQYVEAKIPFYPPSRKWGVLGRPITKMQLPLDAEESLKHFVTPEDFEVQLFAADHQIKTPICMNWDEQGRLWIAESVDYPNDIQPAGQGNDRIVICEDTDDDGRADNFKVFADKLSIPTSFAFGRGGIIVHQAPHTLFLRDTDGDDKADERKILFTGWSTGDTHAGPSNLQYGLDNRYYGIVGYSGFKGTIGGERHSFRTGFYRFSVPQAAIEDNKKETVRFEFLRNTNNNSWGVGISEEGVLFGSTANGNPSVYMPIANRYYEAVRGWSSKMLGGIALSSKFDPITDKVRQVDFHGRFTAGAGHAIYTARTYPKTYWNRAAFVNGPTGHLTATFFLKKDGADYVSQNCWNLLASDDEWSAPIAAEVGPDGHVWVIDWYNYIVQHNPTPAGYKTGKGNAYISKLRDKKHGRIYRIVYKRAQPSAALSLKNASPQKLVETLKHPNMFWRKHAQRLLVERGQLDVVPALIKLASDKSLDEIGLNAGAIHALWTLHGLGVMDGNNAEATAAAVQALQHPSAGVRRNAVLVLPRDPKSVSAILDSNLINDNDGQVRLAAFLVLSEMPPDQEAGSAFLNSLRQKEIVADRWIPDAATSAAAAHDFHFLEATAHRKTMPTARASQVVSVVAEHYARGAPTESVGTLVGAFSNADPKLTELFISALVKGWPENGAVKLNAETKEALVRIMQRLPAGARGQLLTLTNRWGSNAFVKYADEISSALFVTLSDDNRTNDERIEAARQLVAFQAKDGEIIEKLLAEISPNTPPRLAAGIIHAVGESRAPTLGAALVKKMIALTPEGRKAALQILLSRQEATKTLLDAVAKGKVHLSEFTLEQKQALTNHPERQIADQAKKLLAQGGSLPNTDRQKVLQQLLALTKQTGSVAAGKLVFKEHCAACHTHSGEGNKIGPDLTGMAVHPKEELLTQILDPNRSVEGNYRIYTVVTLDGKVFSGLLASETKTSLELFDSQGKKHLLQREDVEAILASNKSLMPEGFEKQVKNEELVDLLEFLSHRGKYLPLPLEKAATVVSTKGMFNSKNSQAERLIFSDWSPKLFEEVPFYLVDPKGDQIPNVILLYGPRGKFPPQMPKSVKLRCNAPARAIHLLSGVSGWGYPIGKKGTVSLLVRLHYADGKTEEHKLLNGIHFADYIRRIEVPKSMFAYRLRNQQLRYLAIVPLREEVISEIEFVSGMDQSAPIIMAVTVETR